MVRLCQTTWCASTETSSQNSTLYSKFRLMKFLFIYCGGLNENGSQRFIYLNTWVSNWWNCLGRIRVSLLSSQFVWDRSFCCLATFARLQASGTPVSTSHLVRELGLDSTWLPGIWTQIPLTQREFYALSHLPSAIQEMFRNYYY